jgi:hypothetical protein
MLQTTLVYQLVLTLIIIKCCLIHIVRGIAVHNRHSVIKVWNGNFMKITFPNIIPRTVKPKPTPLTFVPHPLLGKVCGYSLFEIESWVAVDGEPFAVKSTILGLCSQPSGWVPVLAVLDVGRSEPPLGRAKPKP